jgi:hypothetical protein
MILEVFLIPLIFTRAPPSQVVSTSPISIAAASTNLVFATPDRPQTWYASAPPPAIFPP